MSKLPEELAELQALERLDISHNTFIALPSVALRIPQLKRLLASNNFIIGQYRLIRRILLVTQTVTGRTIYLHLLKNILSLEYFLIFSKGLYNYAII